MKISIASSSFSDGDAISEDAFGMFKILSQFAEVRLFAKAWNCSSHKIYPIEESFGFAKGQKDFFIYCYSEYDPVFLRNLNLISSQKILRYYSITPEIYFRKWNPEIAKNLKEAKESLVEVVSFFQSVVSISKYSNKEILDLKKNLQTHILFPFMNTNWLANLDVGHLELKKKEEIDLLAVGRIAPNKNLEFLIDVLSILNTNPKKKFNLKIVGSIPEGLKNYYESLEERISKKKQGTQVQFLGKLAPSELKKLYLSSELYLSASLHEGFGIPALEAIHFSLPIFVLSNAAVSEVLPFPKYLATGKSSASSFAAGVKKILNSSRFSMNFPAQKFLHQNYSEYQFSKTLRSIIK